MVFTSKGTSSLNLRWLQDCLIFIMGVPTPGSYTSQMDHSSMMVFSFMIFVSYFSCFLFSDSNPDDDDYFEEDGMFSRLEETRASLEVELGCDTFLKAYKTVQVNRNYIWHKASMWMHTCWQLGKFDHWSQIHVFKKSSIWWEDAYFESAFIGLSLGYNCKGL